MQDKRQRPKAPVRKDVAPSVELPEKMRLQRYLAFCGVASRRQAEKLITEGKIKVNGKVVTEQGTSVNPRTDKVESEGRLLKTEATLSGILLFKPAGCICSKRDPEKRRSVFELLPKELASLFMVGRLDYNSEGALLFVNDGALAEKLCRPSTGVRRVYRVRLRGTPEPAFLERLTQGVESEGEILKADSVQFDGYKGGHTWMTIVLKEGKNRHIRRMFEALGYMVARLLRVQYAELALREMEPGKWRKLSPGELRGLVALVAAPRKTPGPAAKRVVSPGSPRTRSEGKPQASRRAQSPRQEGRPPRRP